ncbi:hypothetical protein AN1674.2 [Aspergillus nidulans FGSC A4]|uniref:BRCT domain-containing protein n=1 Tax=Emericella nidulans (strain FGSC A4 / ATCC 38163 / CBS 112.46 / NRRL 194 / M139) TaxID=227321 RepID=Q5BCQ6_EMENI|nr:hypothetical protein [Aspergillus nidulans FGSC A4]EAA64794.1 hypothetical protein AN1674.2 [Aspergillus nidulans FGSC A4]CBF85343.1 TPA: conserved hypothetical protein [Aspergillus nidulans FGSC A4]|eukprot:XP_659278.1 hypothetical protein AN1674.2 [Aspergillus nidulans FGSC A4]
MARAAVIPQSPPKRATRGRAKVATTQTSKSSAKVTRAAEVKKRTGRAAVVQPHSEAESEETDDEIGVIESKSREKTPGAKGKTATSRTSRGRRAAATPDMGSESENDDNDELAQSEAPKKRPGRPKTKTSAKEENTKAAAGSRPRGRPKGTSVKVPSDDDILKENTRRNALSQDSDELSPSQQRPTEIFVTTGSALLRGQAKTKKKVTFQELTDSEAEVSDTPAPNARRRRGAVIAKDSGDLDAKPVRKASAGSTRGRKPAAARKGSSKPLSPKKAIQVAKAISAYASSDGEEDELSGEKDAIKLVVHSPQKRTPGVSGLGSPVRRINFTPNKVSNPVDENGEPTLPPPRTFDFGDSQFMSSPARRPPPSPFHFTLKETPRRAAIPFPEKPNLGRPETTPNQNSPLRISPKKASIATPARGTLFDRDGGAIPQPNFTPGQNSPLKMSAKKGIFGASFSSQQPIQQQNATPFKSSLLLSPARKVITPFKNSMTHVPTPLAKETRLQTDTETDDETVSMYDESPLRGQNFEVTGGGQANKLNEVDERSGDERNPALTPDGSPLARETEQLEEDRSAESDHSTESVEEEDEGMLSEEDDVSPLRGPELDEAVQQAEQDVQLMVKEAENFLAQSIKEELLDCHKDGEDESSTPQISHEMEYENELEEELLQNDQGHGEAEHGESDTELGDEPEPSPSRFGLADGLEDVFTDDYPAETNTIHDDEEDDEDDEVVIDVDDLTCYGNDEPTLVGEAAADHLISAGAIQPYEIEEVEDTPFMNFLLTYWAPTLPFVEEREPITPFNTERSPSPITPEESQDNVSKSPFLPINSERNSPNVLQEPSLRSQGRRFTLLAEKMSQWKSSSPANAEARPRRRGIFSLGRPSDIASAASRTPKVDIFANAPTLSAEPLCQMEPTPQALDVHEDKEDEAEMVVEEDEVEVVDEAAGSESIRSTRSPMAEVMEDENPDELSIFKDLSDGEDIEEKQPEAAHVSTVDPWEEEKENGVPSPAPATPAKNPSLPRQTYHTVSKVPLKPEGEVSPLKTNRKRGRSLSITSPVRSSPRLRSFVLPPQKPREAESPPRKSPRLQYGSTRRSLPSETPSKPVPPPQTNRARTPSRSVSPVKSPYKQASGCLCGAVVYVDVHTTEGEDASGIFIELLQQMGARCIRNWSWNPRVSVSPEEDASSVNGKVGITHVVFKDGGVRTLEKVRQARGLVKCVGVGWVLNCEARNEWVDEAPYAVDSSIIPRGGAKRRKSMEPRALSNINGTLVKTNVSGPSSSRRPSMAAGSTSRSATPLSRNDHSTLDDYRGRESGHADAEKFWQTPRTPSAAALGYNLDSIGMSPATPFYLSQRSKLVQQTCPPKQTRQGLFSNASEDAPSRQLKSRLEAARRKSLALKPSARSPFVE